MDETNLKNTVEKAYKLLEYASQYLASYYLGQLLLKNVDKALWTLEKSAEWSLNPSEISKDNENGKPGEVILIRPLPWVLFLPTLLTMRALRLWLSLGSLIIWHETVTPGDIIKFIHARRATIRSLKRAGERNIKKGNQNRDSQSWGGAIVGKLKGALCLGSQKIAEVEEEIDLKKLSDMLNETAEQLKQKCGDILNGDLGEFNELGESELLKKLKELAGVKTEAFFNDPGDNNSDETTSEDDTIVSADSIKQSSQGSLTVIEEKDNELTLSDIDKSKKPLINVLDEQTDAETLNNNKNNSDLNATPYLNPLSNSHTAKENADYLTDATSEEYLSPTNSNCATPDTESLKDAPILNPEPAENPDQGQLSVPSPGGSLSSLNSTGTASSHETESLSPNKHGKKQKHKRKFSNLLNRKKK